ncbi:hypothetical protein [Actinoplanes sp. NPDC048796]|uniref:hypothetical protein n=1 Tax=unclassified Actinoplanes TaxID=2626549 RepID=UPI00340273AF
MDQSAVDRLSDRSVLLSLQELAETVGHDVGEIAPDEQEAADLLAALLASTGLPPAPATALREEGAAVEAGRRLLGQALRDPDTGAPAAEILADPPGDDQMSVELAVAAAVVLGALVAWLQTKIDIKVSRKDGKTEFEFRATKAATQPALLRQLAETVATILNPPPGP